jgi:hypothetical protein
MIADADQLVEGTLQTIFPRGALDAKTRREKLCGTTQTSDAIASLFRADPAKALVMTYVRRLVVDGYAERDMLKNGDIRPHFQTGEIFLLARTMIIRIA